MSEACPSSDFFWSARNRITPVDIKPSHFHQVSYKVPPYPLQMVDQYGLTPEDYAYDLKILSYKHYGQGMLSFILLFSKQRLKPSPAIHATLILYDFIYHIPHQVRLSICKQ